MEQSIEIRDPDRAFNDAIEWGWLTTHNAGDWMYMYSNNGVDYFKHIETREYRAVPQRGKLKGGE